MNDFQDRISPKNKLIIRLGCHADEPIYWYLKLRGRKGFQSGKLNNSRELKDICNLSHCDVTILVSTSFIIYRKVELHKKKIIRNLKYLKFSFEKTIVGNIDNFHTVILKYDKIFCYVAAVEHELMSCWLKWLDNAGISISLMIPDVLTLPFSEDKCSLLKLDSQWLIRNGEYSGFSIKESIFDKLHLVKDKNLSTNRVNYISEQQKKAHLLNFCDALSIMAENINKDGVNFLSGKYSRYRERKSGLFSSFRTISFGFLLSIGMIFNLLYNKKMVERDIDMLNEISLSFYARYPSLKQLDLDSHDLNYYNNSLSDDIDFIKILHASSVFIKNLSNPINRINFSHSDGAIVFNLDEVEGGGLENELDELNVEGVTVSKFTHDDKTYDMVFKY